MSAKEEEVEVTLTLEAFSVKEVGKKVYGVKRKIHMKKSDWKIMRKSITMTFNAVTQELNSLAPPKAAHD